MVGSPVDVRCVATSGPKLQITLSHANAPKAVELAEEAGRAVASHMELIRQAAVPAAASEERRQLWLS